MNPPRQFTPAEDAIIRAAHAGQMAMREASAQLRCGSGAIYRRMDELGLPRRRADCRRKTDARSHA